MQTIETTGKSVQEATATAARELGASPEDLKVTVIDEHKGLFGKATVRIRAELQKQAESETVPEPEPQPAPEPEPEPLQAEAVVEQEDEESAEAPPSEAGETAEEGQKVEATDEDAERIHGLLQQILESGSLDVSAKVTGTSGRYVNIELDGRDVAFLVGKHGEVLNALQYVLNIIANQQVGNGVRATLDGNNYRHRREEALTKLAKRIAEQVEQRGEEAVLDALPAFERRIVHKALAEYKGVTTYSEGEEPNRRVVIAPAD